MVWDYRRFGKDIRGEDSSGMGEEHSIPLGFGLEDTDFGLGCMDENRFMMVGEFVLKSSGHTFPSFSRNY